MEVRNGFAFGGVAAVLLVIFAAAGTVASAVSTNANSGVFEDGAKGVADGILERNVTAVIFYGDGCPHCAKALKFLSELERKNSQLKVLKYEVYFNDENRKLFSEMSHAYGIEPEGVPTIFIGEKVVVGWNAERMKKLELIMRECMDSSSCPDPLRILKKNNNRVPAEEFHSLTIPALVSAAVVDSINPCAFAVLIILLGTILASGNKKRALFSGFAFIASIYISYFLMGIGLYSAIETAGMSHKIYLGVAILAIIIGLLNLKDYFWYGKGILMEVPLSWRPKLKALIKGVTSIPGAFMVGFGVSLFLLPCTSGPYIVILGLLSKAALRTQAIMLLLLYNAIFVLPMIGITIAVYYGLTSVEKAEKIRKRNLRNLHLIAGVIMISIGALMILLF